LAIKIGSFLAARKEYHADNSSGHLIVKNETKKIVEKAARSFANSSIRYNVKMTEADKLYLGIHERDRHCTPQATPTDHVEFSFRVDSEAHAVFAYYRIDGGVGHSKGRYHGVDVRFWTLPVGAPGPVTADDPAYRAETDTATPWKHTFDSHEIGMRLHLAMRWANNSVGKTPDAGKGPWSAIKSVMIA
jgi:hypothetical protein